MRFFAEVFPVWAIRAFRYTVFLAMFGPGPGVAQETPKPLSLKTGERVLLLGSALVEHEQFHGYLEMRLASRFPAASIQFRNVGWSGDTVRGNAPTSGFQRPDGIPRLLKEAQAFGPSLIFLGYGTNESFEGEAGLAGFLQGLGDLLKQLKPLNARVVILSPTFHEDLGRPFPDPQPHNRQLQQYVAALDKWAADQKLDFIDLYQPLAQCKKAHPLQPLTTNGLLPNAAGYWAIAQAIDQKFFSRGLGWQVELDQAGKGLNLVNAKVGQIKASPGYLQFALTPDHLPILPQPGNEKATAGPRLRIAGLTPGTYLLRIQGKDWQTASASDWQSGLDLKLDPGLEQAEKYRREVIKKNELCLRRWRPFNDHERHWGFIGGDFKLYDAQIAAQEKALDALRRPASLSMEIVIQEKLK